MTQETIKSCATWPKGCFDAIGNYSEDTHVIKDAAIAVCKMLRKEGTVCDKKHFYPLQTWVEELVDGKWIKISV